MPAGADIPAPQRFRACDRVRKRFEFRRIQATGQRVHSARFLWLVSLGEGDRTRLGVTVTKKVASAVGRNRIKRVVREVFRQQRGLIPAGVDVVVIAKRQSVDLDYASCVRELEQTGPALARAARRLASADGGSR